MNADCKSKNRKQEVIEILMGSKTGFLVHVGWGKESAQKMKKELKSSDIPILNELFKEMRRDRLSKDAQVRDYASSMKVALQFAYISLCEQGIAAIHKLCLDAKEDLFMDSFFSDTLDSVSYTQTCSTELSTKADSFNKNELDVCKRWK